MSTTIPCFVANWKMNKTILESDSFLRTLDGLLRQGSESQSKLVIAPPFTALSTFSQSLRDIKSDIRLAAQNVHFETSGAYTGEISAGMLQEIGCTYVIIGHSERRNLFGETDADVHRKLKSVLNRGLFPILCIGESIQERSDGHAWTVLENQLRKGIGDEELDKDMTENVSDWLIAYEPVWAIGTGETPHPDEVALVHKNIQDFFATRFKGKIPRILYGGSVSEKNIKSFMDEESINGVLVGGASLSANSFYKIAELGSEIKQGIHSDSHLQKIQND